MPRLRKWHFNVLFVLAVFGAVVMLIGDTIGITVRPEVVGLYGLVMAFVLQQKEARSKDEAEAAAEALAVKAAKKVAEKAAGKAAVEKAAEEN